MQLCVPGAGRNKPAETRLCSPIDRSRRDHHQHTSSCYSSLSGRIARTHAVHACGLLLLRERSIVMSVSVCLSICLSASISLELHVRSSPIFALVTYGRGSVLLWRRSDTLYISGFMDDVIFAHKPKLLDVAAQLKRNAHAALGLAINCAQ